MPLCKRVWRWVQSAVLNIVLALMFIIALATITAALVFIDEKLGLDSVFSSSLITDWGAAGDYFGGLLNPIISFIALTALLFTIRQNNIALEATQDELAASREEMARSAHALERQVEINRRNETKQDCYTAINSSFDSLNQHLAETHDIGMYCETLLFILDKQYFTNETVVSHYEHIIDDKIIAPALTHISLLKELRGLDPDSTFLRFQVERVRPHLIRLKRNDLLERERSRPLRQFLYHHTSRYFDRYDEPCY